jgi:hypothetical protein
VPGRAGQLQGRLAVQQQGVPVRDLARREAGQDRKRGVNIAGVDRPGPGSEQVVLFGAEPHRPKHLLAPVVLPDVLEEADVVVGVPGLPPVGVPSLVEVFFAVLADGFQQSVAGLGSVLFSYYQGSRHQAGQQLEHRIWVDTVPAADRLGGI